MHRKEFQTKQEQSLLELERFNRSARFEAFEEEENQQKDFNDASQQTDTDQYLVDESYLDDLAKLIRKRELTPEELAIKTEFDEYVKLVKKHVYPDYTDKEQLKFERKIKKFERKMANGLTRFSEKLKIGTWGSEDYFRLRDKFFPNYMDVINDEIDRIKIEINITVSELTSSLSESIRLADAAIILVRKDQKAADSLMIDSAAKMQEAIQKRAKASETLKEYGTDENSVPILAEFDKIIARYKALNELFLDAFSGMGEDLIEFEKILPELDRNEHLLNDFNVKLAAAKKLSEFQDLKNIEIPILITEIDTLYNKALSLNRTTGAVDEIAYKKERDQMDQTILEQEGKVDQIKADEIERRRLAEIERKRKEEEERKKLAEEQKNGGSKVTTSNSAMLDLSPTEFFVVYEQRAQKYLDQYYNRDQSTWKTFKKNHSDIFLTGKELADAAKYVYENATKKDLKLIAPVELAISQAKIEGGIKPASENARTVINPMNVGVYDGGNDNKKALSLFEIRDQSGWKEARKEGLRYYYKAMYNLWMPDYNTTEEMLEYDHFDKNGNTNYTGRYATAVYYEAEVKAEIGIMRMTEDGKLITQTIGGGNETTEDKKSVFAYIQAFDKYPGKLKKTSYSALVKLENGIPTSSSLSDAIRAIQKNEIYPDPSTFSKNKKAVYDRMGAEDKKGSTHARATGVDGKASKLGPTIGFLYYHYLLTGGSVFNSETNVTLVNETNVTSVQKLQAQKIVKLVTDGTISIDDLGRILALYATTYPDLVIAVIDEFGLLFEDDISEKISFYAENKLSSFDTKLLTRMRDALDPDNNMISTPNEKKEWDRVKTALGKDLSEDKNVGKHYTVTSGDAWVRDEKGQELNTEGGIFKKGDKHKIIPKGTKVIVTEEKDAQVKVKSEDGKTIYGWTNKSNLTRIASVSEIKAWKNKKVTATTIADKNKEYAELILEAEELGITQFSHSKVRQTFVKIKNLEKIGSGKKKGESANWYSNPETDEIVILETIISILKTEIDIWLAGDQKGKISNVKIGSFMIWNDRKDEKTGIDYTDELRTTNHGGKGRAIDLNIDGTDFTSDAALEMVNRIISNLPKIDDTYEIGLPFQGQFFPIDQMWTKKDKSKPLKLHEPTVQSGSKIVLDYIKSEKLKTTIKDLQKKGYKFQIFPDAENHLHLAVE